jgi:hypothetical protein
LLLTTCQKSQEPTTNQEAFRRLVKYHAESIPPEKWEELPTDRILDSFAKGDIDLAVPFRFTPEEFRSLAPILKCSRPRARESAMFEFTGEDAKAMALRKVLLAVLRLVPEWFPTNELSRLLMVAAETLIHEPGSEQLNLAIPQATLEQRRSLGLWTRKNIRSEITPHRSTARP